jgi:hypothetical protein
MEIYCKGKAKGLKRVQKKKKIDGRGAHGEDVQRRVVLTEVVEAKW